MSNRKLRQELEELRKRVAELELKTSYPYPAVYLPAPIPANPGNSLHGVPTHLGTFSHGITGRELPGVAFCKSFGAIG